MTNHFTGNRLQGRTALVTGSTSNIGRAIAVAFAAEGAHVIVSGRDAARGDETIAAIQATVGRADFLAADLDDTSATSHARCRTNVQTPDLPRGNAIGRPHAQIVGGLRQIGAPLFDGGALPDRVRPHDQVGHAVIVVPL